MTSKRILIATDIPFWHRSTGAEQRIASLIWQLSNAGLVVRTFYIGSESTNDAQQATQAGYDVHFYSSDRPSKRMLRRVRWWFNAVRHRFFEPQGTDAAPNRQSLTLADFRWPWAVEAFAECASDFQPTSIICQYIKMAYLLDGLSDRQRKEVLCTVDTHDVQHLRQQQFRDQNHAHWLTIDRDAEANALSRFDLVIAIQQQEAVVFREMVPDVQVVVCGHVTDSARQVTDPIQNQAQDRDTKTLSAGYLASANQANFDAIKRFIHDGWLGQPQPASGIRLFIAGKVCEQLLREPDCRRIINDDKNRIQLLGPVDALSDFYDRVDVVINPVRFGAGLKIKNGEALAFGKPLITTPHGVAGMDPDLQEITVVADSPITMMEVLNRWSNDRASLNDQTEKVQAKRPDEKRRKGVYRQLMNVLR